MIFAVFLFLWIYLNFAAPRPREISEALNDNYVNAILIHKTK